MPNKKSKSKNNRSKRSSPGMMISVTPLRRRLVTLTFASTLSLTEGAAGAGAYNFYRMNGPYDPDTAVLSDSTPGLASLATLYRSMRVMKCSVEAGGCFFSQNHAMAQLVVVPVAFQPVLPSNPRYWAVQPQAGYSYGTNVILANYAASSFCSGTLPRVRKSYKINDVMNITRSQYVDEADFATPTNSNPVRQAYVAVGINGNSGTAITASILVKLKYVIEFYDPYPLQ